MEIYCERIKTLRRDGEHLLNSENERYELGKSNRWKD